MKQTCPVNGLAGTVVRPLRSPDLAATDISLWELSGIKHIVNISGTSGDDAVATITIDKWKSAQNSLFLSADETVCKMLSKLVQVNILLACLLLEVPGLNLCQDSIVTEVVCGFVEFQDCIMIMP
jgi:hypothetical protein